MEELPFGVLFYSVNGGRMLPLQNVIPRCQIVTVPCGTGREKNQAGYLNYPSVSHIPIPTRVSHFWLAVLIELTVYTYHPRIE